MNKVFLGVIGVIILFAIIFGAVALGYRADCVRLEAKIQAQYKQNQNNYDNYWKKIREMAQVPGQYVEDMKKIWDATMRGRYGDKGSQAVLQFIKEHNPQLDPSVYTRIQAAIEAGRNSFAAEQQQLLDVKREYEVVLKGNRGLFVGWLFGFPTLDLTRFDIVTSGETERVFEEKKSDELDVFGKRKPEQQ